MSSRPTLSILISNYNHARFLPESLRSILDQSHRPLEIIVVDDASTDDSIAVIEGMARTEPILRLVRNARNLGVIASVNRLLEIASGDYVYPFGADDRALPGFIEKSMQLVAEHPEAGLCSALSRFIDEIGRDRGVVPTPIVSKRACFFSPEDVRRMLCVHGTWMNNSAIYRRDALLRVGGLPDELGSYSDGFIQQVVALRHGVCFIPEPLVCWRRLAHQYSAMEASDPKRLLEISEHANRLIRTEYNDLFPEEYIPIHQQHRSYWLGVAAGRKLEECQEVYLEGLRPLLAPPTTLSRAVLASLQLAMRWQLRLARAYLYVRLRRITWAKLRGLFMR